MATCHVPTPKGAPMASDPLHQLKQRIRTDPSFAEALRQMETTEQAVELIHQHGLEVTPEALWRHRGTLVEGGRPTWRG
ncbi:MAG: Nif11-like leader peptide family natural product precursor [Cyanobacteriota bacterium]|nr:Nif11-like leader peptide family natural product precursor [Cyanobacteriota bacterium]